MSYDFAETCVFGKQSLGSSHCGRGGKAPLHPFFRSYGAILPSSLERVLSRPLVSSTSPPVSVCGTGDSFFLVVRAFLGRKVCFLFHTHKRLAPSSLETQKESVQECSPDLPSTPPFGYILGPDSPSVDEPCRGTLRLSGQQIHTAVFVTQADILTSALSTSIFMVASLRAERSPTITNSLFISLRNLDVI